MSFDQLGLSAEILHAIHDQGYTDPTPIQAQAIPPILDGKDIMGGAQTGTGKTASFTLPMLHRLQPYATTSVSPAKHPIRALILVPTRELAAQVFESVKTYGKYLSLKCTVVYGGVNIDPQIRDLRAGVEILVATPGRMLDHIQQKTINLSKVEILVLDEADRMLDMGFLPDIKRILTLMPQQRQSLMFSATFSEEIKKLANNILIQPILIEVAKCNSVSNLVTHIVHPVNRERKRELLTHLIKSQNLEQVLVFVRTKHGASNLVRQLEKDGISSTDIHGDKSQPQRTQALAEFKQGKVRVLVATDVAARGLDIEDLPHVVNFELPNTSEDYIHRIGRTGRAGTKGWATSLVCDDENELLEGIENLLNIKLPKKIITGFEPIINGLKEATFKPHEQERHSHTKEKKSSNSHAKSQNKSNSEPNSKKNVLVKEKQLKAQQDPLFSQPYVPTERHPSEKESTRATTSVASLSVIKGRLDPRPRNSQQKKPLPALFMPHPTNKSKQNE
ncbi:MAG: DEAD/DEAH box helicase [Nitrosomonadales bacterium]|nr:MAG: DEAD/DEAH box helicase [Nitrosomonadales bacterium]